MYFVSFIDCSTGTIRQPLGHNGSQGLPDYFSYCALPPINFMLDGNALLG